MINEQELRDIYYDPSEGYQSAEKLYQKAKADRIKVSKRMVRNARHLHEVQACHL